MLDLRAPDLSEQPINNLTVQQIGTLPPFGQAYLDGRCNADWEQAIVVYINDIRQPQLLGNYDRMTFFGIPHVNYSQTIAIAGWHKRSKPDGNIPWQASRGRKNGDWVQYDDSAGDLDFDDFQVKLTLAYPTVHFPSFHRKPHFTTADQQTDWDAIGFLTSLANLKATAKYLPEAQKTDLTNYIAEVFYIINSNLHHSCHLQQHENSHLVSKRLCIAAELHSIASTLPENDLQKELLWQINAILNWDEKSQ